MEKHDWLSRQNVTGYPEWSDLRMLFCYFKLGFSRKLELFIRFYKLTSALKNQQPNLVGLNPQTNHSTFKDFEWQLGHFV